MISRNSMLQRLMTMQHIPIKQQALLKLLEGLKPNDQIEGQIVEEEGQLLLQTRAGIRLPISLLENKGIQNKWATFIVVEQKAQTIELKPITQEQDPLIKPQEQVNQVLQKVIESFKLPNTEEMKECIKLFIQKELPLEKQSLSQTFYLHKQVKLPIPVLVNLMEKKAFISSEEIKALALTKDEGKVHLFKQIMHTLKEAIGHEGVETKLFKALRPYLAAKNTIVPLKDGLSDLIQDEYQMPNAPMLKILPTKIPEGFTEALYKFVEDLFFGSKETLVDPKKRDINVKNKFKQSYEVAERILEVLEKVDLPPEHKEQLPKMKEMILQFVKMEDLGGYYMMPLKQDRLHQEAEIYFFKPKKNKSKVKDSMYVVVALDLQMMGHLEVHIRTKQSQIYLDFYVESEVFERYMSGHLNKLQELLETKNYTIASLSCSIQKKRPMPLKETFFDEHKGVDYRV